MPPNNKLKNYITQEDPDFSWHVTKSHDRLWHLKLMAHQWHGYHWQHRLYCLAPEQSTETETALLWIVGSRPAEFFIDQARKIVDQTTIPVFILGDIPNQPLCNDLSEDALIAYTFEKALQTGECDWLLLFPMVKSVVRALDAAGQFHQHKWQRPISRWVVAGASKRGWATWLAGAIDQRIVAIVPMMYDNLNFFAQLANQVTAWGALSEKIDEYSKRKLPQMLYTSRGKELATLIDPYHYRRVLRQPKIIIIGTNDRYWPINASDLYYDELPPPRYLLYLPNSGHDIEDFPRVTAIMSAVLLHAAGKSQLPRLTWHFSRQRQRQQIFLEQQTSPPASQVTLWIAQSSTRDFREALWQQLPETSEIIVPRQGFLAVYAEFAFQQSRCQFHLTSNVHVFSQ